MHAVQDGDLLCLLDDAFAQHPRRTGAVIPLVEAELLAPVEPRWSSAWLTTPDPRIADAASETVAKLIHCER